MWYLWLLLFVSYLFLTWRSLREASSPSLPCRPDLPEEVTCFQPSVKVDDSVALQLELYEGPQQSPKSSLKSRTRFQWVPVETCLLHTTIPKTGKLPQHLTKISNETTQTCQVKLPDFARHRSPVKQSVQPLKARFLLFKIDHETQETQWMGATDPFDLTRIQRRDPSSGLGSLVGWSSDSLQTKESRNLLQNLVTPNNQTENTTTIASHDEMPDQTMWIPFLKYRTSPIRIRFIAEDRGYAFLQRADGLVLRQFNATTYAPMLYVDDLSLPHSAQIELAPPQDDKPPVTLHIKFGSISPTVDAINRQVQVAFATAESMFSGPELDEIRYYLQDERLYRFALTQVISYVHMWLDYLAFRDEIRFYRGRQKLSGVSTSTVLTRLACSVIILLYLLDGGGTSWVVLLSLFSSCAVEAWKATKLLKPTLVLSFPFIKIRQLETAEEKQTAEYDRIAYRYLAMLFYPVVAIWSLYALKHYEYTSWYSWFISNMANAVYTFGFISMCPQLYVNYRLKSVAHLPWKVFMYKIFNTFVDDAFAWLIEMPLKHRLMTLRDDVVFVIFLIQVYNYRTDKSRTNEFGYSYDEDPNHVDPSKTDEKDQDPTSTDKLKAE